MTSASFMRRVLRVLTLILIAYAVALSLMRIFESHFLFFPDSHGRLLGDWAPKGLPIEDAWFKSSDGTKLHSWWIPNEGASYTFLAFHGNAGSIADRAWVFKFLRDVPANVFAVEYRGYGKSEGVPSESGLYLDAQAAFDYLVTTKRVAPEKIISFGQSLGTSVAANLAARRNLGGVILEAPFPSAAHVVRQRMWFFPGLSLLVLNQLGTERQLRNVNAPILIVHCTQDPVIPLQLGKAVYDKAREPKTFLPIDGYCHEEASIIAPALYQARIRKFLSEIEQKAAK
jgi:uncharacterized protein